MKLAGRDIASSPQQAGCLRLQVLPWLLRMQVRPTLRVVVDCRDGAAAGLAVALLVEDLLAASPVRRQIEVIALAPAPLCEELALGVFRRAALAGIADEIIERYSDVVDARRRVRRPVLQRVVPVVWDGLGALPVFGADALLLPDTASGGIAALATRLRGGGFLWAGARRADAEAHPRLVSMNHVVGLYRKLGETSPTAASTEASRVRHAPSLPVQVGDAEDPKPALRQQALLKLAHAALVEVELQPLFALAVDSLTSVLGNETSAVLEAEPGMERLRGVASVGIPLDLLLRVDASVGGHTLAGAVIASDGPLVVPDLLHDERFTPPPVLLELGIRAGVATKIPMRDGTYGILSTYRTRDEPLDEGDVAWLQAVARILGAAAERARESRRARIDAEVGRLIGQELGEDELIDKLLVALQSTLGGLLAESWTPIGRTRIGLDRVIGPGGVPTQYGICEPVVLQLGQRGVGRVLGDVRPLWLTPTEHPQDFCAARGAVAPSASCGVAFPVTAGERLLGVLTIFFDAAALPDPSLFAALDAVGRTVGEYLGRRRAEDEATRTRRLLRKILDSTPDFMALLAADGSVVYGNDSQLAPFLVRDGAMDLSQLQPTDQKSVEQLLREPNSPRWVATALVDEQRFLRWRCVPWETGEASRLLLVRDVSEEELAHRARAEAQEMLEVAQEASSAGFWDWYLTEPGPTGSAHHHRMLGLEPGTPLPFPRLIELIHPDDRDNVKRSVRGHLDDPHLVNSYVDYRLAAPPHRWMASRARISRHDDGTPYRVTGITVDITQLMQAKAQVAQSEERFRTAVMATPESMVLLSTDGHVLEASDAYDVAFPGSSGRSMYCVMNEYFGAEAARRCRAAVGDALASGGPGAVFELGQYDGPSGCWEVHTGAPIKSPAGEDRIVVSLRNVTEHRRSAADLLRASQEKDQLMAMLGHELRNPLAALVHAVALLDDGDREVRTQARSVLARQGVAMRRLVDDMFDVSRSERGKLALELEPQCVGSLVDDCVSHWSHRFQTAGISLAVQRGGECWVKGDRVRLEQVVGNLLGNAIKFTRRDGAVTIGWRVGPTGRVLGWVEDDGEGFDEATPGHLFEAFRQGPQDSARTRGGLGLGLALVRSLVQAHHGTVRAASAGKDQGARFEFDLPVCEPPLGGEVTADVVPFKPRDILLIEDHEDNANMLATLLRAMGHSVRHAPTGLAGIAAVNAACPDIVLCDVGLPDISGHEVARTLRTASLTRPLRLVSLSGYGEEIDRQRSREAGFEHHFTKPLDFGALEQLLQSEGAPTGATAPGRAGR